MDRALSIPGIGWNVAADSRRSVPEKSNVVVRIGAFLRPDPHEYEYPRPPALNSRDTPPSALSDPRANHLIAALPDAEFAQWLAHLEPYDMPLGKVLFEPGCPCTYAYFPTTAIISMLYLTENGESVETAVAGCEGIVGLPPLMSRSDSVLASGRAMASRLDEPRVMSVSSSICIP